MLYGSQGCQYDQSHQGTMTQSTVDGLSRIVSVRPSDSFNMSDTQLCQAFKSNPMPLRLHSHTYKSPPPPPPFDTLYTTTDRVHGVIMILCYQKVAGVCKTEHKGEFTTFFAKLREISNVSAKRYVKVQAKRIQFQISVFITSNFILLSLPRGMISACQ